MTDIVEEYQTGFLPRGRFEGRYPRKSQSLREEYLRDEHFERLRRNRSAGSSELERRAFLTHAAGVVALVSVACKYLTGYSS